MTFRKLSLEESDQFQDAAQCVLAHLAQHSENLDDAMAILTAVVLQFIMNLAEEGRETEALDSLIKGFRATIEEAIKERTQ